MNETVLEARDIVKRYTSGPESLTILDRLDFSVGRGESAVILGESGSGKSTLLNLIGGLDKPDAGTIIVNGARIDEMDEQALSVHRQRSVGYIFQFHYLLNDFSAAENVMLPLYMMGMPRKKAETRAEELLAKVRLESRLGHYPHQLSGGERQRVAVARALANDPDIILADEPTGNLDERHSAAVENLIFALAEESGKTLIAVTHDTKLADRGDARYLLHDGVLTKQ